MFKMPTLFPNQPESVDSGRRNFLRGAAAAGVALALESFSLDAEAAEVKSEYEAIRNNQIGIRKLGEWLNDNSGSHEMFNSKADNISIYNKYEELERDFNAGEFTKNENKYYKPKQFHNLAQRKALEDEKGVAFQEMALKADFAVVAEIQGANRHSKTGKITRENLMTSGFAVLKKGTAVLTRTVDGVTENYIAACFNRIYIAHVLCPPCKPGECKK